jgi:DNA-binding HxlR family transcriptional regulator
MESNELYPAELAKIGKETLRLIGSRGTMEVLSLFCCSQKKVRFTELSNLFKHISTKTLASRLKELEKEGILNRTAYNEIPPRVEYSMTEKGQSLAEAVGPIMRWMVQWSSPGKKVTKEDESSSSCCPAEESQTMRIVSRGREGEKQVKR